MQIFGMGLTPPHWKTIFHTLQKALPARTVKARLLESADLTPAKASQTALRLAKSPPALVFVHLSAFASVAEALQVLSQLQFHLQHSATRFALLNESPASDLAPWLAYHPRLGLANKMELSLSGPQLLRLQSLQRFPRIRLDESVQKLEYTDLYQRTLTQTLEALPIGELIALSEIQQVHTEQGPVSLNVWLSEFLARHKKNIDLSEIKGILKEVEGCYLFPGVPADKIDWLKVGDVSFSYVLPCPLTTRALGFKRLLADLQHPNRAAHPLQQMAPVPMRSLGELPIVNLLAEKILAQKGWPGVKALEYLPPGEHHLDEAMLWLQWTPLPQVRLQGKRIEFLQALESVLEPLRPFLDLFQLTLPAQLEPTLQTRLELEQQLQNWEKQEKQLVKSQRLAQNKYLLLKQEETLLAESAHIAEQLMLYLGQSRSWESLAKQAQPLDVDQVLLFSEDQDQASEMSQHLHHIRKKLWINPSDYNDADELRHLKIKTIAQYAEHGVIVVTATAMRHWEVLSQQVFESSQEVWKEQAAQQKQAAQIQAELEALQRQKNELAVHWIYGALQQLIAKHQPKLTAQLQKLKTSES